MPFACCGGAAAASDKKHTAAMRAVGLQAENLRRQLASHDAPPTAAGQSQSAAVADAAIGAEVAAGPPMGKLSVESTTTELSAADDVAQHSKQHTQKPSQQQLKQGRAWGLQLLGIDRGNLSTVAAKKLDALVDGIVAAVRPQAATEELDIMQSVDPEKLRNARLPDGGAALFDLVATVQQENQLLHAKSAAVSTKAKDAGEFTFGDRRDFSAGIEEKIGLPTGVNEDQFMAAMAAEHCDVAPGEPDSTEWGASDKPFTTGNYSLTTTPRQEYMLVAELKQADGKKLQEGEFVPGAYEPDGTGGGRVREKPGLQRQVVSIAELMKTAVRRKCLLITWLSLHNAIVLQIGERSVQTAAMLIAVLVFVCSQRESTPCSKSCTGCARCRSI